MSRPKRTLRKHCAQEGCSAVLKPQHKRTYCDAHVANILCPDCGRPVWAVFSGGRMSVGKHCSRCKQRIAKYGTSDVSVMETRRRPHVAEGFDVILAWLEAGCDKSGDGCWVWAGCKRDNGYGSLGGAIGSTGWPTTITHRLAFWAANGGVLPKGVVIHHTCANTSCCNPAHLVSATVSDNTLEMMSRQSLIALLEAYHSALSIANPQHPLLMSAALLPVDGTFNEAA